MAALCTNWLFSLRDLFQHVFHILANINADTVIHVMSGNCHFEYYMVSFWLVNYYSFQLKPRNPRNWGGLCHIVRHITLTIETPEPMLTSRYGKMSGWVVWKRNSESACLAYTKASWGMFLSTKLQPLMRQLISSSLSTLARWKESISFCQSRPGRCEVLYLSIYY